MKPANIILFFISIFLFSTCKENPTSGGAPAVFSVNITVKDVNGIAVPHLRVIGGSLTSLRNFNGFQLQAWANAVYRARLIAEDSIGGSVIFRDSIIMVFGDVDPANPPSWLGYTSSNGELNLSNPNRFPGVYALPPIPETDNTGPATISNFTVLDTAIFILRDTLTNKEQTERRVLRYGVNTISIRWAPAIMTPVTIGESGPSTLISEGDNSRRDDGTLTVADRAMSPLATTSIHYEIATNASVHLSLVELDGTVLTTPIDRRLQPGLYALNWDALSAGSDVKPEQYRVSQKIVFGWKLFQNYPNPFD